MTKQNRSQRLPKIDQKNPAFKLIVVSAAVKFALSTAPAFQPKYWNIALGNAGITNAAANKLYNETPENFGALKSINDSIRRKPKPHTN